MKTLLFLWLQGVEGPVGLQGPDLRGFPGDLVSDEVDFINMKMKHADNFFADLERKKSCFAIRIISWSLLPGPKFDAKNVCNKTLNSLVHQINFRNPLLWLFAESGASTIPSRVQARLWNSSQAAESRQIEWYGWLLSLTEKRRISILMQIFDRVPRQRCSNSLWLCSGHCICVPS